MYNTYYNYHYLTNPYWTSYKMINSDQKQPKNTFLPDFFCRQNLKYQNNVCSTQNMIAFCRFPAANSR